MYITGSMLEMHYKVAPASGSIMYRSKAGNWIDAGHRTSNGYIVVTFPLGNRKYKKIRAHHLVWVWETGAWPAQEIDHINGDRADNRIQNLREATVSQNRTNKKIQSNNTGYKWVTNLGSRYRAEIRKSGKRVYSSIHDTAEEAYQAACDAARRIQGAFFNDGKVGG